MAGIDHQTRLHFTLIPNYHNKTSAHNDCPNTIFSWRLYVESRTTRGQKTTQDMKAFGEDIENTVLLFEISFFLSLFFFLSVIQCDHSTLFYLISSFIIFLFSYFCIVPVSPFAAVIPSSSPSFPSSPSLIVATEFYFLFSTPSPYLFGAPLSGFPWPASIPPPPPLFPFLHFLLSFAAITIAMTVTITSITTLISILTIRVTFPSVCSSHCRTDEPRIYKAERDRREGVKTGEEHIHERRHRIPRDASCMPLKERGGRKKRVNTFFFYPPSSAALCSLGAPRPK